MLRSLLLLVMLLTASQARARDVCPLRSTSGWLRLANDAWTHAQTKLHCPQHLAGTHRTCTQTIDDKAAGCRFICDEQCNLSLQIFHDIDPDRRNLSQRFEEIAREMPAAALPWTVVSIGELQLGADRKAREIVLRSSTKRDGGLDTVAAWLESGADVTRLIEAKFSSQFHTLEDVRLAARELLTVSLEGEEGSLYPPDSPALLLWLPVQATVKQ